MQATMNTVLSQAGQVLAQQAMQYAARVPAYVAAAQQQLQQLQQQQQQPQQPQRRSSVRGSSEMDQTIHDESAPSEDQVCVLLCSAGALALIISSPALFVAQRCKWSVPSYAVTISLALHRSMKGSRKTKRYMKTTGAQLLVEPSSLGPWPSRTAIIVPLFMVTLLSMVGSFVTGVILEEIGKIVDLQSTLAWMSPVVKFAESACFCATCT